MDFDGLDPDQDRLPSFPAQSNQRRGNECIVRTNRLVRSFSSWKNKFETYWLSNAGLGLVLLFTQGMQITNKSQTLHKAWSESPPRVRGPGLEL